MTSSKVRDYRSVGAHQPNFVELKGSHFFFGLTQKRMSFKALGAYFRE